MRPRRIWRSRESRSFAGCRDVRKRTIGKDPNLVVVAACALHSGTGLNPL